MPNDFVSIVVPTLAPPAFLHEHLARIAAAGASRIELILVCAPHTAIHEGGFARYGFKATKVVAGRDVSQPDAINLGAHLATGDLVTWLNPGDGICADTVQKVLLALRENADASVIYGRARFHRDKDTSDEYPVAATISLDALFQACCISQPAAWITRAAWKKMAGVRPLFDCAFDYDLWIRTAKDGGRFVFLDSVLADIDVTPGSKTFSRRADVFREQCELLMLHYGRCPPSVLTAIWAESLAPAEGYSSVTADLLRHAAPRLKSIARTAVKVGDYHTARRLCTDARLHFLSRGLAVESRRDGYLAQSGRIRISSDRLPLSLLFQFDRMPESTNDVAILVQPEQDAARCTLLSSISCMATRIEPNAASSEDGFATLAFLSTSDFGVRLIDAW